MNNNDGPRPGRWGGIRSGRFEIHALGKMRTVEIDLADNFAVRMDMGGKTLADVPDHLLPATLDLVRAVTPPPDTDAGDDATWAELRADNAQRAETGDYSCGFDSDTDPEGIPDGYGCGGCSCHMSAPCSHCMRHLPDEDSDHIDLMLGLTGRAS